MVLIGPSAPPVSMPVPPVRTASAPVESSLTLPPPLVGLGVPTDTTTWAFGGFWIRVVAWVIDWIVTGIPVAVVRAIAGPVAALPVVAALLLYFPLFESSARQGTFGKQICGLAVTDTRGQRISFGRALGRYFAKFLSALVLGIGFLMVAFTPRKRGLHDLIAGTLVVRR